MSSDKAGGHFDGSSGINLVVLCKVLGDKHSDCTVGSYPVCLTRTHWPMTWTVQMLNEGALLREESTCSPISMGFPWRHIVWDHYPFMKHCRNHGIAWIYLSYTVPDLPYLISISSSSLIRISALPWLLSSYSGTELWGLKEPHESSSTCLGVTLVVQETSYAVQAFCHAWTHPCVLMLFQWGQQFPWSGLFGLYFGQIITVILLPAHAFSLSV